MNFQQKSPFLISLLVLAMILPRSLNLSLDPIEAFEAARQRTQPHEIYVMRYQSKGFKWLFI
jgi:hypothetical protein